MGPNPATGNVDRKIKPWWRMYVTNRASLNSEPEFKWPKLVDGFQKLFADPGSTPGGSTIFSLAFEEVGMFKPGDKVRFKGIKKGNLSIGPFEGELQLNDKRTNAKGIMSIKGDANGMLFHPDGTIYCHGELGSVLTLVRDPSEISLEEQEVLDLLNKVIKP